VEFLYNSLRIETTGTTGSYFSKIPLPRFKVIFILIYLTAAPSLKRLVIGFPPRRPWFDPGSGQVGFVVDKVALEQVFSEYFGFSYQFSFHQLLHNHPHLSSGAGTIGQKWPQYKGLSPTPLSIKKIYLTESISKIFCI
jgi:hypothetical protein